MTECKIDPTTKQYVTALRFDVTVDTKSLEFRAQVEIFCETHKVTIVEVNAKIIMKKKL